MADAIAMQNPGTSSRSISLAVIREWLESALELPEKHIE